MLYNGNQHGAARQIDIPQMLADGQAEDRFPSRYLGYR
jgi:hypothetical protein